MSTPSSSAHDIVVVGARASGAATAMLLARAGLDVLVVDRSRYGAATLSTHALMRGGVVQLHRWGLLDEIIGAGTPAVRATTFRFADEDTCVFAASTPARIGRGGIDESDAFDHYHRTRNRLSIPLFDVVDTIAAMRWSDAEIPGLLRTVSSTMSDEVELLARLDEEPAVSGAPL